MSKVYYGVNEGTFDFYESVESKIASLSNNGIKNIGLWTKNKNRSDIDGISDCLKLHNVEVVEINFITELFNHDYDCSSLVSEIDECIHLAKCLNAKFVTAASFCEVLDPELVRNNIKKLSSRLKEEELSLALEFLPWTAVPTVGDLWSLISDLDLENVSILLDSFHFFKGDSSYNQLDEIPIEKIQLVHLNDFHNNENLQYADLSLIEQTRGFRLFPGDGDFPIKDLLLYLKNRGFEGYMNLEVLNSQHKDLGTSCLAERAQKNIHEYLEQL